ncbi:hypothetical protein [Streptomyces sp. NPDC002054]|uniref:hypothetical protein n=1 Tax=Streptomyces sp. NPDC002054 TaxID=3154663 RepID=UPI00333378C2
MKHDFAPIWFRLPPGFHDIHLGHRSQLEELTSSTGSSKAEHQVSTLMEQLEGLAKHHVVHTAIGLHPDKASGLSASLFSLTVRPMGTSNPRVAVARTGLGIARSPLWSTSIRQTIDLPSSLPCCLVTGTLSLPGLTGAVFQARITLAHGEGPHVLVLDLTSASTEHHEEYTAMLEGIAYTVSFADPTPPPPRPSRILEVLL